MKGSLLWKLMYVLCALAGCLAGYGVFALTGSNEVKPNTITKDNTLVREAEDGVFFDEEENEVPETHPSPEVAPELTPVVTPEPTEMAVMQKDILPSPNPSATPVIVTPTAVPEVREETVAEGKEAEEMPSLASQWVAHGASTIPTPIPVVTPIAEVITYPVEIFGQVPVINRSDAYVSYFEFAYDLVTMLEPVVEARGLNMNSLLAKFVIKALFCGVDIEKLDINAPIPRRLAALCLWLAAQILEEAGNNTTAKSAQDYVIDIGRCSSAEKKAVAYLYEQGILEGFQKPGQQFYPDAGLKTESENIWLSKVKQCWN